MVANQKDREPTESVDRYRSRRGSQCGSGGSRRGYGGEASGETLILLAIFLHYATCHQVLQLLIGTESEHLLPAARGVTGTEILVDHFKKLLEFERAFRRQNAHQFLSDKVRNAT